MLVAVERLDAAPDRLWLEVSLGPAAGRGYPGGGEREGGDSNQSQHFLSGGRPDAPRGNGPTNLRSQQISGFISALTRYFYLTERVFNEDQRSVFSLY